MWRSLGVAPVERWFDLQRTGSAVRVQELGEGPPVIFVHGGSISGTCWAPLVARLPDFRCIVLDRPGCGLSRPLSRPFENASALGAFADALVIDLLDAMGLERADVCATSFGGYMALRSAAAHPERIRRMVLFGFSIGAPVGRTPLTMRLATAPGIGRLFARAPVNERTARMILRNIGLREAINAGRVSQEGIEWFVSLLRDTDTLRNEMRTIPPLVSMFGGMNESLRLPGSLLGKISTPVHFLWGEADLYGGPDIARAFVRQIPRAELELLPGVGHAPWMDDPNHAEAVTREFLQRPEPS